MNKTLTEKIIEWIRNYFKKTNGLKLDSYMDDDVKKYYIREDDNANKVIHTFSEGKNHFAKLLKEYKTLKQQIKVKELEKDFG